MGVHLDVHPMVQVYDSVCIDKRYRYLDALGIVYIGTANTRIIIPKIEVLLCQPLCQFDCLTPLSLKFQLHGSTVEQIHDNYF